MNIKKRLGRIKYKVLECYPYQFMVKKAEKKRHEYKQYLEKLPPLPISEKSDFEIHTLCGKKHLDMGIWATYSIARFLKNICFIVHSDGTLDKDTFSMWKKIVPNIQLIEKDERNQVVKKKMEKKYPILYNWRCNNWASAQLIDVQFFGKNDRLLNMDTDVLCFQYPTDLVNAFREDKPRFRWGKDLLDAYTQPLKKLKDTTGLNVPHALCAGFLLTPRLIDKDFAYLEKMLSELQKNNIFNLNHNWATQTYYGFLAANSENAVPLPQAYDITKRKTTDEMVLRHFVGVPRIRPRYFLEGVPRILRDLNLI